MPKLNGTDLAKRIAASAPICRSCVFTGLMQEVSVLSSPRQNRAFLPTPVGQQQLATQIQALLPPAA